MKTREIEEILKNRGMERGTLYVLQSLNEEMIQLNRDIKELAQLLDKMSDIQTNFTEVASRMKEAYNEIRHPELGPNTHMLGED